MLMMNKMKSKYKNKIKIKQIIINAENGEIESQAFLACSYFEGKLIKKNSRKSCYWAHRYMQNNSCCSQYDDYIHYIMGRFKFEGKFIDYDLDDSRRLLEKSYSHGFVKSGLYLCEFVYPKYPLSSNYGEKRVQILRELTKCSETSVSNYAKYLLEKINHSIS